MKNLAWVAIGLGAVAGVARLTLTTITVAGQSMWPTMGDQDVWLAWRQGRPRPGRIAMLRQPTAHHGADYMIKRLLAVNASTQTVKVTLAGATVTLPARSVWAVGDNRENSLDSRSVGALPLGSVVAYPFRLLTEGNSEMSPDERRPERGGRPNPSTSAG